MGSDGGVLDPPALHRHLGLERNPSGRQRRIGAPPRGHPRPCHRPRAWPPPPPGINADGPAVLYAVAGVRLARSLIRLATSRIPRPIKMNSTPIAMAMAATPKATTEVNREACRNEAVCAV
jgi:hypothetical protein